MADPTFPVIVPADQIQDQGVSDAEPIFQTFRGPVIGQVKFTEQTPPELLDDGPFLRETP